MCPSLDFSNYGKGMAEFTKTHEIQVFPVVREKIPLWYFFFKDRFYVVWVGLRLDT